MPVLSALIVMLAAGDAVAPQVVHVGDPVMHGATIRPYDNLWLVTVHYPDGRDDERGLSSDHVRFREIGGQRYLTRVEGTTSITGRPGATATANLTMTFNIFDPATMAPVRGEARGSDGSSLIREFTGRHVATHSRDAGTTADQVTETDLAEPVFDFHGGMTGLLLAALPLARGYVARLPGLGDDGADLNLVRVVGEEQVRAGHFGHRRAWRVEIGPAPAATTYWISRQAPYVIRVVVRASNATASWNMVG